MATSLLLGRLQPEESEEDPLKWGRYCQSLRFFSICNLLFPSLYFRSNPDLLRTLSSPVLLSFSPLQPTKPLLFLSKVWSMERLLAETAQLSECVVSTLRGVSLMTGRLCRGLQGRNGSRFIICTNNYL